MSVRCISQVLEKSVHAGTDLLMMIVLADYSDDDGNSYPAVASLARKCRMKPRNAIYILKALQASGELRVLKNEGPKGCNRYRIMLASLGAIPLQRVAPLQSIAPLQSMVRGGAILGKKGVQPIAPEPSLNRQEPSVQKNASVLFDRFWKAYPKKTAKPAALKAFKAAKITEQLIDTILADIERRKAGDGWKKENGKYTPNPATYLNQRRWEDESNGNGTTEPKPWEGAR